MIEIQVEDNYLYCRWNNHQYRVDKSWRTFFFWDFLTQLKPYCKERDAQRKYDHLAVDMGLNPFCEITILEKELLKDGCIEYHGAVIDIMKLHRMICSKQSYPNDQSYIIIGKDKLRDFVSFHPLDKPFIYKFAVITIVYDPSMLGLCVIGDWL